MKTAEICEIVKLCNLNGVSELDINSLFSLANQQKNKANSATSADQKQKFDNRVEVINNLINKLQLGEDIFNGIEDLKQSNIIFEQFFQNQQQDLEATVSGIKQSKSPLKYLYTESELSSLLEKSKISETTIPEEILEKISELSVSLEDSKNQKLVNAFSLLRTKFEPNDFSSLDSLLSSLEMISSENLERRKLSVATPDDLAISFLNELINSIKTLNCSPEQTNIILSLIKYPEIYFCFKPYRGEKIEQEVYESCCKNASVLSGVKVEELNKILPNILKALGIKVDGYQVQVISQGDSFAQENSLLLLLSQDINQAVLDEDLDKATSLLEKMNSSVSQDNSFGSEMLQLSKPKVDELKYKFEQENNRILSLIEKLYSFGGKYNDSLAEIGPLFNSKKLDDFVNSVVKMNDCFNYGKEYNSILFSLQSDADFLSNNTPALIGYKEEILKSQKLDLNQLNHNLPIYKSVALYKLKNRGKAKLALFSTIALSILSVILYLFA